MLVRPPGFYEKVLVPALFAVPIALGYGAWVVRPKTWLGWAVSPLVGWTSLWVGGRLSAFGLKQIRRWEPADEKAGVSPKRVAWLLGVVLASGCATYALWRFQARYLGDPVGALDRTLAG